MDKHISLSPCPFCGSSNTTLDYYEISCPQELGTIVVCNDCGASAKSIVDWNIRPVEDALNARIAELEAAQRWIPVGEKPLEAGTFFVLLKNGEVTKDFTFIDGGRYYWWNHGANITHYMPLPTPPEVK